MKTAAYVRATGIFDDSRATKEILSISKVIDRVVVLSWDRRGDASKKCDGIFPSNVELHFFLEYVNGSIGFKNILKLLKWIHYVKNELSLIDNLDIVHACDLDSGIGAYKYCKKHNVKMVYDIFDYYVDSHKIPLILSSIIEKIEIDVINNSNVTVICTEERKEQIRRAKPKKTIVIHNSPDVEKLPQTNIHYDYVYCGTLGSRRLIAEILDKYKENCDLHFLFAGAGSNAEKARELALAFDNFEYKEVIPYSEVIKYESQAAVISAIYIPTIRNHRLCAPNKFYEALALGKPVIACEGTGIDNIVRSMNIGDVIKYDPDEFYSSVRKLKNSKDYNEICQRARNLYDQKYKWTYMDRILQETYKKLLNER